MSKNVPVFLSLIFFSFSLLCDREKTHQTFLEKYLNQPAPGLKPVLFFPEFFPVNVRDIAITPDGKEIYFTQVEDDSYKIMYSKYKAGEWSAPSVAPFSGKYNDFEPCISAKGDKFYFASMRPSVNKRDMKNDIDIWVMDRTGKDWSKPRLLGPSINTNCMEYYPSISNDETLYFGRNDLEMTRGDIYFSRYIKAKYTVPVILPESINLPGTSFNAFIEPDESYIIFSTYVQDSLNLHSDLYISFRDRNGEWSESRRMGEQINSKYNELSPWVSHDGKYLFFTSTRLDSTGKNKKHDIFWIDASVIERYRPNK